MDTVISTDIDSYHKAFEDNIKRLVRPGKMMKLVEMEAPNSTIEGLKWDCAHDVLRLAVGDPWFAEWTTKAGTRTPPWAAPCLTAAK